MLLHYQMGDDEYAIAMKTDSSQSLTIPEDNDESMVTCDYMTHGVDVDI